MDSVIVWFKEKRWRDYNESTPAHKQKLALKCQNSLLIGHKVEHLIERAIILKKRLLYLGAILTIRIAFRDNLF